MGVVTTTRHLALLGGLRTAPTAATETYTLVAAVGGLDLDLRNAEIPAGGVSVTKVSLVGGAHLRIPPGCPVEVRAFVLVGRKRVQPPTGAVDGPPVRVQVYGLFGGVRIER